MDVRDEKMKQEKRDVRKASLLQICAGGIFYRYFVQDDRVFLLYYFLSDMDNFLKAFSELSENKIFFEYMLINKYISLHLISF